MQPARLLRSGDLTPVYVLEVEAEAIRDVGRARCLVVRGDRVPPAQERSIDPVVVPFVCLCVGACVEFLHDHGTQARPPRAQGPLKEVLIGLTANHGNQHRGVKEQGPRRCHAVYPRVARL